MFIYRETINTFLDQCRNFNDEEGCKEIADAIKAKMISCGIGSFDESMERSWRKSLPAIADVIKHTHIDFNSEVAIEYKPHQTRERIDFLISGIDDFGNKNLVIIELKQWSKVQKSNLKDYVFVNTTRTRFEDKWHPSYQADSYANTIANFNVNVRKIPIKINACSYLHNLDDKYSSQILEDESIFSLIKERPCFLKGDREKLASFLEKYVKHECNQILYDIENSEIVPSDYLGNLFHDALHGTEFNCVDEGQRKSISTIIQKVREAYYYNQKTCLIVKGGAGTGKSIVALNVLGQLLYPKKSEFKEVGSGLGKLKKLNVAYFTANGAPRYYMESELIKSEYSKSALKVLFKNPSSLKHARENEFDCGLFDEGHRIFDFKGGVGLTKDDHIFEKTIKACKVSVFFMDEDQIVTKDDYATIDKIIATAKRYHAWPDQETQLELTSQFRCMGGEEYIAFVKSILGYDGYCDKYKINKKRYDFRIFDSAKDMFDEIKRRDAEEISRQLIINHKLVNDNTISGKSRMLSGYTKEWVSLGEDRNGSHFDFEITDVVNNESKTLKAKWNLRTGQGEYCYIADPLSVNEIGCIHTIQGLDLNYAGVIISNDVFINSEGKLDFDRNTHPARDKAFTSKTPDDICKRIIRNTYNVLLSRGIKGTYIYCENDEVRKYIENFLIEE